MMQRSETWYWAAVLLWIAYGYAVWNLDAHIERREARTTTYRAVISEGGKEHHFYIRARSYRQALRKATRQARRSCGTLGYVGTDLRVR